ncbi:MAG: tetratricopeptide repeat protein [candidate division WOR-3 bacterium]
MGRFENLEISIKQKPEPADIKKGFDDAYYLKLAQDAQLNGDFEAALRYYSRALSYKIDIPEAWSGQVLCLIDLGEFDEAIVWADKACEVIGINAELLALKAMALGRKGEIERALGYSEQAMKKGSNSLLFWLSRGDIVIARDFKNAEFCFKKALECDNRNPFTHIRIGISYLSVNEPAPALKHFKSALELCPKSPFIYFLIGKSYQMMGLLKNAKEYYERALKIKPDYPDCIEAYKGIVGQNIFSKIYYWIKRNFFMPEGD